MSYQATPQASASYEQLRARYLYLYWRAMCHYDFVTLDLMLNEIIILDSEYISNLENNHY